MGLTSGAVGLGLRGIGGHALRSLQRAAANPSAAQAGALRRIIRKNANTAFGEAHGFDAVSSRQDFHGRVVVQDYEAFRPYVQRILEGEEHVLTAEPLVMLARTSGTTGEPKLVPVTKTSVVHQSRLTRVWMAVASSDHPGILDHAALGIVSPAIDYVAECGLPVGSASGMIYRSTPSLLRRRYAVPEAVFSVPDYDSRYFLLARFALSRRLSVIATPNPATLLRLADVIQEHDEALIAAICDGTPGSEIDAPAAIRDELRQRLQPEPRRARELAALLEEKGGLEPALVWPDLRLVGCWLGGTSGPQAQRLADRFGPAPFRDLGYLATEGHFTVPLTDASPAGLLELNGNYYEFVPEGEDMSAHGVVALGAHELEVGQRYRIVLTTPAGLYRYDINDIVEVTGHYRAAPMLAFVRKGGEMANLTGEKLHANHLIAALVALRAAGSPVRNARLRADADRMGYELLVELEPGPEADQERLARSFDDELMRVNIEYAEKRRSGRLAALETLVMPSGWGDQTLRRHLARGGSDAQYKWRYLVGPDCSPGREDPSRT